MELMLIHQKALEKKLKNSLEVVLYQPGTMGPKLNDKIIPRWPPSSPDLSAIELVWSIIKTMLNLFPPKSIYELKSSIQKIWESIPPIICSRIIEHIKKRWELCIKSRGRRLDKELLRKILPNKEQIKWKVKNSCIEGVRISYNDIFVLKLKDKDIKERAKKINEQKKMKIMLKRN